MVIIPVKSGGIGRGRGQRKGQENGDKTGPRKDQDNEERTGPRKGQVNEDRTGLRKGQANEDRTGLRKGQANEDRTGRSSSSVHSGPFRPQQRARVPDVSIYGTIAEGRRSDMDVFAKYDFNSRAFDTSELVINKVREKILLGLAEHQVMMIEGFTGCGKTTQVPQFILNEANENKMACRIVVTQPRRIAAISVANRVVAERNWRLGGLVGFQVGMNKVISEDTRLIYMTTGVLLQTLINRKNINEWTHIIIDEVHERDLDTDLLLLVIKKIMKDSSNCRTRIILMSATLSPEKFEGYFPVKDTSELNPQTLTVSVDMPNQYPIQEYFLEDSAYLTGYENFTMEGLEEPKVHQECFEIATRTIEGLDELEIREAKETDSVPIRGAVLVFLPGLLEIETFYKILVELINVKARCDAQLKWMILPLHSSITNEEQQRVFIKAQKGFRKIILATNIAESSITVPDIKYVIDFCLTKNLSCDASTNYTCLRLDWASINQCIQRRGRCGRVSPGVVYRMVTRKFYGTLEQEAIPEMLRSSLESVVLQVKLLNMGSPKAVLALAVDPPDVENIGRAVANLKEIGALTISHKNNFDPFDGALTFIGKVLARLPIDIRLGRFILLGHAFDCLEEAVIIAAGLSVKSPFAYPYSRRLQAYLSKMRWSANSFSDCIALLNLYTSWHKRHMCGDFRGFVDEKNWARSYYVQLVSLREMKQLVEELHRRLSLCGIELTPAAKTGEDQFLLIKLVIAGAFYPNYFIRTIPGEKEYRKEVSRELLGQDPFTSVALQGFPIEQPGELYAKIIAKKLVYENSIPNIMFQGSRVVVTFDSRGTCIGPISTAVYRAVKMRQLREHVTFHTPSRDVAQVMVNKGKQKLDVIDIQTCPAQVALPDLKTQRFQAIVTNIVTPSEFYVIMKRDEKRLEHVSATLMACLGNGDSPGKGPIPLKRQYIIPGQICVVNERGTYYRARIDAEKDDDVMVYLIDIGMTRWLKRQYVIGLTKELIEANIHLDPPALAIRCRLSKVRAAVRTGCIWSSEALRRLDEFIRQTQFQVFIEIYSVVESVIAGVIRNSDIPGAESLNDILVKYKLADEYNESVSSKENNDIRELIKRGRPISADTCEFMEKKQISCQVPQLFMEPPREGPNVQNAATLRGPFSPLEMTFSSLCRSAHLKVVASDGSSVNSVVLDQDPSNSSSRILVAANVAIAARSGNIMARETTLMPAIPGLCGLLAMLFSPKLEFRVDEDYTKYTGCVTGLGVDPKNLANGSLYPDHDMEIIFDTEITETDIKMVNSVRSCLNTLFADDSNVPARELRLLRIKMRKEAIELLERKRASITPEWPDESHVWNRIDPAKLKDDVRKERDIGTVFPLHPYVKLSPNNNTNELGASAEDDADRERYYRDLTSASEVASEDGFDNPNPHHPRIRCTPTEEDF